MDSKELRGLYEAYSEVYVSQEKIEEASYSAKASRAGKDIGKPGKAFAKIAKEAGERYGSKERGEKVAGAVLAKLRKEDLDIFDVVLEFLQTEGFAETLEEAEWIMANIIDEEVIDAILNGEQLNELSNRKLRAYIKKSDKSHQDLNKKWDKGTATYQDKYKSINREQGQERAFKTLDKRVGK
jgi:hypothetical protein